MAKLQLAIDLDAADVHALRELAAHDRQSLEDVVTLAVRNYVARRTMNDNEWRRRWDEAIARIRDGVPADVTPEEIDADVREACAEYRKQRRVHGS